MPTRCVHKVSQWTLGSLPQGCQLDYSAPKVTLLAWVSPFTWDERHMQSVLWQLYWLIMGVSHGPLFLFEDGSPLTKRRLVTMVRIALESGGVNPTFLSSVTGHSFWIGAATAAALEGMEDSLIQTLGRWRSSAYHRYIRIPAESLASCIISKTDQPTSHVLMY